MADRETSASIHLPSTTQENLPTSDRRDSDSFTDAQLIAPHRGGRDRALAAEIVNRHQQRIRSLAYRFVGRWDLADDIAQETFLRVYRSADRYEPTAAFSTWLYRITANLCSILASAAADTAYGSIRRHE